MVYNKASEERKWCYWKEQEEKKLRELGMDEEKIRKLRQMDWEDFLEERRYRERLEETIQEIDTGKPEDGEPFAMDVQELLDHVGDRRLYGKRLNFRHGYKNPRPHFCNRSTLIIHI